MPAKDDERVEGEEEEVRKLFQNLAILRTISQPTSHSPSITGEIFLNVFDACASVSGVTQR